LYLEFVLDFTMPSGVASKSLCTVNICTFFFGSLKGT